MRTIITALALAAFTAGLSASQAHGQAITGLSINKNPGNSADFFQDTLFVGSQRTSVTAVQSFAPTAFTTRYSFVVGADTGAYTTESISLSSDYRVNFNVTAPGAYILNVTTTRNGALTLVDDGTAPATATISAVTGAQTGGTVTSGSLNLPGVPNLSGNGGGNTVFDASGNATIAGTSNGVPQAHQLSFTWSSSCSTGSTNIITGLTGGDECAVRGGIAISYSGQSAGNYPGVGGRNIATDGHFVTVTLTSLCGNGIVEGGVGEECDEGPANGTVGSCCASNCTIRPLDFVCRPITGPCDADEVCDGVSPNCPPNDFEPPTVICRAASAGEECDADEYCDGTSAACPPDEVLPMGTECRPAAGVCDLAEECDGTTKICPSDAKSTAVCRAAAGVCDLTETCTGTGNNCPPNAFVSSTTVCRGAVDVCDLAETCTGTAADCPGDAVKASGTSCTSDGNPCTVDECDGTSTACQHPAGNAGTQCRAAAGVCDVAELCTGTSSACPADEYASAATPCRAAAGPCDVAETCTGTDIDCPADGFVPDGTSCEDPVFCNGVESCLAGACQPGGSPCGVGESCDEATAQCFLGGCPTEPVSCRTATKNILLIKDKADDNKDKLIWKFIKGENTTQAEFADPTTSANYALCFYAGTASGLIGQIQVPPGGATWSPIGTKGYKYLDSSGSADGATKVTVKGSATNKTKAMVKGKGANLPDFTLPVAPGDLPMIVQLRNNATGICWGGSFTGNKKNQAGLFKDKNP